MKNIIGLIQPFDAKQTLYVYEDHNIIETATVDNEHFNEVIFNLCNKYDISCVNLQGPKQYNRGLARRIQEAELEKYCENKINVNII